MTLNIEFSVNVTEKQSREFFKIPEDTPNSRSGFQVFKSKSPLKARFSLQILAHFRTLRGSLLSVLGGKKVVSCFFQSCFGIV